MKTIMIFVLWLLLISIDMVSSGWSNEKGVIYVPVDPGSDKLTIQINNGVTQKPKLQKPTKPPPAATKPSKTASKQTPTPVVTATPSPTVVTPSKLRENILNETNTYRKIHDAKPLTVAESLDKAAQGYADELALLKKMVHSEKHSRPGQGENLAQKCSMVDNPMTAKEAIGAFYDEIKLYNFIKPNPSAANGHFTQLVWKESEKTGSGGSKFVSDKGEICYLIVIRYVPSGNVEGSYFKNVVKGSYKEPSLFSRQMKQKGKATITVMSDLKSN